MSLGYGPQYHPPELDFWNLLGTKAQVEQSAAGPNCTERGNPTYHPGYFGGAVLIDANAESINAYNHNQIFNQGAGCLECWLYNDGWTYTNGASSSNNRTFWGAYTSPPGNLWTILFQVGGFLWQVARNGVHTGTWAGIVLPGATAGNQEWHHWAFVWDVAGIGGGPNIKRIYFDGALVGSSNLATTMPFFLDGKLYTIGLYDRTFNFFMGGRLDNIKHWNYAKTDFSDRFDEGFTPPAPPDVWPEALIITPKRPRVVIMGQDIVCRLAETPKIVEKRSIGADLVFPSDCKLVVEDFDGSFSLENPRSIFAGTNWQNQQVEIWDREDIKVWDGVLSEPQVDHDKKRTTIVSRSNLYEWRNHPVAYAPAPAATPAEHLLAIAQQIGFPHLDMAFLQRSIDQQTAAGLSIAVALIDNDNATFGQVLNKLADYGAADCYEHLGKLRYVYYDATVPRPSVTLTERDYMSVPKPKRYTKGLINDYAIWDLTAGAATTDSMNGNIGAASRFQLGQFMDKRIPGNIDPKYSIASTVCAVALGEAYIRRTHVDLATRPRPRIEVKFDLEVHHRVWVDLASDFAMDFEREAWDGKIFRVVSFTRDDERRKISLVALEWPS